jgi:hypothetical protein
MSPQVPNVIAHTFHVAFRLPFPCMEVIGSISAGVRSGTPSIRCHWRAWLGNPAICAEPEPDDSALPESSPLQVSIV